MNKKEIKDSLVEFATAFNSCHEKKIGTAGFHADENGNEYLVVTTGFDTIYYGLIELLSECTKLELYGVRTVRGKIHLLFFRGECEMIDG